MAGPSHAKTLTRAYSLIETKSIDEAERVIEGVASTPTPDRMLDVVEPLGALFSLPIPLLWQHDHKAPIGHVEWAKPNANGIPFRARLVKIDEPGKLRDRLDEAWQSLRSGLVAAVSIGFSPIEAAPLPSGGLRFIKWNWLELSCVTVPANAEATIETVKAIDAAMRESRVAVRSVRKRKPRANADGAIVEALRQSLDRDRDQLRGNGEDAINMAMDALIDVAFAADAELRALAARLAKLEVGHA